MVLNAQSTLTVISHMGGGGGGETERMKEERERQRERQRERTPRSDVRYPRIGILRDILFLSSVFAKLYVDLHKDRY